MFLRIKFPTSITGLWPAIIVMVAFTKSSQKISTHLLTVLIMSVILHIEQRKRNKKKSSESGVENVDNTQEQSESV